VSGAVTLDGKAPATGTCASPTDVKASVVFENADGTPAFSIAIPCSATDYGFSGWVLPGTYKISVVGGPGSSLSPKPYVVDRARVIATPVTGLMLDVRKTITVSGSVTLNGAAPQECAPGAGAGSDKGTVMFRNTTTGTLDYVILYCGTPGFAYTIDLFPGTYEVGVSGGVGTDVPHPLPTALEFPSLSISVPQSALILDVKAGSVTGTITLNGAAPTECPASAGLGYKAGVTFCRREDWREDVDVPTVYHQRLWILRAARGRDLPG
jgi:hypothetical protein